MTLDTFRSLWPEFRTADDGFVQARLDLAAGSVDAVVYGVNYDRAHGLKAADMLARTPFGRSQRLVSDDGTTIYGKELEELRDQVAVRTMVV